MWLLLTYSNFTVTYAIIPQGQGSGRCFPEVRKCHVQHRRDILLPSKLCTCFPKNTLRKREEAFDCGTSILSASTLVCTDFCRNKRDEFNDILSPFQLPTLKNLQSVPQTSNLF